MQMSFEDQPETDFDQPSPLVRAFHSWLQTGAPPAEIRDGSILPSSDFSRITPETLRTSSSMFAQRNQFIETFGFCVPLPAMIDFLSKAGSVLEVGAGTGYLSRLVNLSGGSSHPTDLVPVAPDVEAISATDAIIRDNGRSLVVSAWPSYDQDWLAEAARSMAPGQKLLYVGEDEGGCTASQMFFDLIGQDIKESQLEDARSFNYRFFGLHDHARLFVRI